MDVKADQHLDRQGLRCPMPVIRLAKAIQVGRVLEMLATDPGSTPDMEAWTKQTGHQLVGYQEQDGVYVFHVVA